MKTKILSSLNQIPMAKYRVLFLTVISFLLFSCKKDSSKSTSEISIKELYVTAVKAKEIKLNYTFSNLGYQETGVEFYKKSDPSVVTRVKAIREKDVLLVVLQDLLPETEYGFKVYFKQDNEYKTDTKEYSVKTLVAESAGYALEVKNPTVIYDEKGSFSLDIEGDKLNELVLSDLVITLNNIPLANDYPIRIADNKFKFIIKGAISPANANYTISGTYQGKRILSQTLFFTLAGGSYWIDFQPTNLYSFYPTVFDNELWVFRDTQVSKWIDAEVRLKNVSTVPANTFVTSAAGYQFEGQIFFPPTEKTFYNNPSDLTDSYKYPEGYSYSPATDSWSTFSFKAQSYAKTNRNIQSANYFVHKAELYLTYGVKDNALSYPGQKLKTDNYLFHFNKSSRQFEEAGKMTDELMNFHYVSVDDQLYLLGLVPAVDQGFKLGATFAVFKMSDSFVAEQIFLGGTTAEALELIAKSVVPYDHKILISAVNTDFRLFDPSLRKLYPVYLKSQMPQINTGLFLNYKGKLNLNADYQKIYEVSISKGL
jgi:hypothetical protein